MYDNKDFDLSISARRPDKDRDFLTAMSHWDSIIYVLSTVRHEFYPSLKRSGRQYDIRPERWHFRRFGQENIPSQNVIGMNDMHLALRDVSVGKVKYMVWIKEPSRWFIHKYSFSNLTISDANIPSRESFHQPHKWITESMDESLASMQQNGETDYLHAKWFNHQNKQKDNSYIVLFVLLFLSLPLSPCSDLIMLKTDKKSQTVGGPFSEWGWHWNWTSRICLYSNLKIYAKKVCLGPTRVHPDNKDFIDDVWKIAKRRTSFIRKDHKI